MTAEAPLVTVERRRKAWTLVGLTIAAAPAALALETVVRALVFSREMETLRSLIGPYLTGLNWGLVLLTLLLGALSLQLYSRGIARAIRKLPDDRRRPDLIHRKKVGSFMLVSSLPQVPVLLATLGTLLGGSIWPTLVGVAFVSVFILLLGLRLTNEEAQT